MTILPWCLYLVLCYLVGAIPSGLIVSQKFCGIDIREHGSKNIGMTNVWRVCGARYGLLTFLIDVGKAYLVVLSYLFFLPDAHTSVSITGGLAVLLGNFFNIFLGMKGGKGVATGLGVFLALAPKAVLICFALFLLVLSLTRYISVGSIAAATALPLLTLYFHGMGLLFFVILAVSVLVIWKHRTNIKRLARGQESKFYFRRKRD